MPQKREIQIHQSLEQLHEDQAKYIIAQSPEERIRETVQLILRVFGQAKKSKNSDRIYIDKV